MHCTGYRVQTVGTIKRPELVSRAPLAEKSTDEAWLDERRFRVV
jgi:hypothetical protein